MGVGATAEHLSPLPERARKTERDRERRKERTSRERDDGGGSKRGGAGKERQKEG